LPQLEDMQANRTLSAEGTARNLPLQNLGIIANLLTPLAGLGGNSTGTMTGTTNTQYQQPLSQTFNQWATGLGSLWPKAPVKFG
jgi:hypothetical protein